MEFIAHLSPIHGDKSYGAQMRMMTKTFLPLFSTHKMHNSRFKCGALCLALKQWTGDSKGQGRMSCPYPIYFPIPSFLPRVFHMSTFPCVVFPSSYPETFQVDNPYRAFVTMEEDYYVKLTWNTRTTILRLSTAQLTTMIYPMRRRRRCSLSLYSVARCWIPGKNCTTPPLD